MKESDFQTVDSLESTDLEQDDFCFWEIENVVNICELSLNEDEVISFLNNANDLPNSLK